MNNNHTDYNFDYFPPSYSYNEILKDIKENEVAYCYYGGSKRGSFVIKINGSLSFLDSDESLKSNNNTFEMWSYLHEMQNGVIRQEAINRWQEVYNNYYSYLKLGKYQFRIK